MLIDEKIQQRRPDIEKILDRWGFIDNTPYGQRNKKRDEILNWFGCFEPSEFEDALLILDKIQYHNANMVNEYIESLSKEIKKIFRDGLTKVKFYPLGESPSSSGGNFLYMYKTELGLLDSSFPYTPINETDFSDTIALVFFDDMIGSGNHALEFARQNFKNIKIDIYYAALLAFKEGYDKVKQSNCFKDVIVHTPLSDEYRAFSSNSQVFTDKETRKRIKRLCRKYGKLLFPKHPLGYDNSQALIVFPHNTPNNTLPIIWASSNNEKMEGQVWHPVWERKKVKKTNQVPTEQICGTKNVNIQFSLLRDDTRYISLQQKLIESEGLSDYFTDFEDIQQLFGQTVSSPMLIKRIFNIHGIGGVGKSSLLRILYLQYKKKRIPIALAIGQENKSPMDILSSWNEDLKSDGVLLMNFAKTLKHYRSIPKYKLKTTETIGPEKVIDIQRSILSKPDNDLLSDPSKKLTEDFLNDITLVASEKRLVLMLDTFEELIVLDTWIRNFAQKLHPNVLLVIAGRNMVDWKDQWPGWLAHVDVQPIEPMTDDVMRELVCRYFATQIGVDSDPVQVNKIIRIAHGLPLAVKIVGQIWIQTPHVKDFDEVEAGTISELVNQLLKGVPPGIIPVLEAAATMRYFNKEILRVVAQTEVNDVYKKFQLLRLVYSSINGHLPVFRLHEIFREVIDRSLQIDDPGRHRELHERAAVYFEKCLEKVTIEEAEKLRLEQLYHRTRADEVTGIQLFHEMAEELIRYGLINHLRGLLTDVKNYSLEKENSQLWREYYNARLAHLEIRLNDAVAMYSKIANNAHSQPRLRAYSLSDLGEIYSRFEYLMKPNGFDEGVAVLEKSTEIIPIDEKTASSWISLSWIYRRFSKWEQALFYVNRAFLFYQKSKDINDLINCLTQKISIHSLQGQWKNALDAKREAISLISSLSYPKYAKVKIFGRWSLGIWVGQWNSAEKEYRESVDIAESLEDYERYNEASKRLGWVLGLQGKHEEMKEWFTKTNEKISRLNQDGIWSSAVTKGFQGLALLNKDTHEARIHLQSSLEMKEKIKDNLGLPELFNGLAVSFEIDRDYKKSEGYYRQSLYCKSPDFQKIDRLYFECGALTGLLRVKYSQKNYSSIPPLLAEAEKLAKQYEYNDHLASLCLYQGHIAWEGENPWLGKGFDAALHYYRHALIYALRYNRFLLDEVLSAGTGTALEPIISYFLQRSEEGRKMLIALHDWWSTGINDIGVIRQDTISPIPENIPLIEAEKIAREREPGDGSTQVTMIEQIKVALL